MGVLTFFLVCALMAQAAIAEYKCTAPGKFTDTSDNTKYHQCSFVGGDQYTYNNHKCPADGCFDGADQTCDPDHCMTEMKGTGMAPDKAPFKCTAPGKFPHSDASKKDGYFKCVDANGVLYMYEYQCRPTRPCFSAEKQACQAC